MESDAQLVSSDRCSIGFRSGDILGHWITFTLFFFRNPTVALDVCLGSLSCWKSARRPRARSDCSIFSFSIEQYICEFMMPSMKCSSPTPAALMQPHIRTLPYIYIYIYAFSRRFYPKRLTVHSSDSFYIWSALAFPGNRTHDLGVASAMLYQLSYRKAVPWKPPPCFTVGTMHFSLYSSPLRRHTVLKPSVPKTFILVSSLQSIESQ